MAKRRLESRFKLKLDECLNTRCRTLYTSSLSPGFFRIFWIFSVTFFCTPFLIGSQVSIDLCSARFASKISYLYQIFYLCKNPVIYSYQWIRVRRFLYWPIVNSPEYLTFVSTNQWHSPSFVYSFSQITLFQNPNKIVTTIVLLAFLWRMQDLDHPYQDNIYQ